MYTKTYPFHVQLTRIVAYQSRANVSLHFFTLRLSQLEFKSAPTLPLTQRAFCGVLKVWKCLQPTVICLSSVAQLTIQTCPKALRPAPCSRGHSETRVVWCMRCRVFGYLTSFNVVWHCTTRLYWDDGGEGGGAGKSRFLMHCFFNTIFYQPVLLVRNIRLFSPMTNGTCSLTCFFICIVNRKRVVIFNVLQIMIQVPNRHK